MSPERWRRIESILGEALEHDPSTRADFLQQACGGDHDLRAEVEALLAFDGSSGKVIADLVESATTDFDSDDLGMAEGDRLGVYGIVREIGRGGMGTVYLGERADDQFRKKVAIKVVTRGMDTAALLRRFRYERQILARLENPYIARLLDGGSTSDGRPYLVMEYVEGRPITEYCAGRNLGIRERIELFRKICSAVQSAHQSLVVHRDLKPANILVDAEGNPKLLDFGVAKLLDPDDGPQLTIVTGGGPMLTPDYASPEQVRGEPITTASDVYSLGAILYELLAGVRAHRLENYSLPELDRAICREMPTRPSTAARVAAEHGQSATPALKPGELDNIILMAMQKSPSRRYGSASELSDDLGRYLDGLPVRAREDTLAYRAGKFIRRNRAAVAAAALLVATLAGGIAVSATEARRAQRRFNEVRRIAHAVLYDIHDAIRDLQGSTKAREIVVSTAIEYLDGLAREAGRDPDIQLELAEAYERVASVQGDAISRSMGRDVEALENYRKSMRIADDLATRHPESGRAALIRIRVREPIGSILVRRGRVDEGIAVYREGEVIGEAIALREPSNRDNLDALANLYLDRAGALGDIMQAVAEGKKGIAILEHILAMDPGSETARQNLANCYANLEGILYKARARNEALDYIQRAVKIQEALAAEHPLNSRYRRNLGVEYGKVAEAFFLATPTPEEAALALEYQRKALDVAARMAAADPADRRAAFDYGYTLEKTDAVMPQDRDHQAALALLRQATGILEALLTQNPEDARVVVTLAATYYRMGPRLEKSGDLAGAAYSESESVRIAEGLVAKAPQEMTAQRIRVTSYRSLAQYQARRRRRVEALDAARKAIAAAQSARSIDPANPATLIWLPQAYDTEGEVRATLAAVPDAPSAQRRDDWRLASEAYEQAAAAWAQIQARQIGGIDRDAEVTRARAQTARCSAAAQK